MARVDYTIQTGTSTHTSTYDAVYSLLQQISVQDIINCETGEVISNIFPTIKIGNGEFLQTIRTKMAKDAVPYDAEKFFNDVTLNKPEFVQEFHENFKKIQYNVGYNRKDLASALTQGKSEEAIKSEAVGNLSKKVALDDGAYLTKLIFDKTNTLEVVKTGATTGQVNLGTFRTVTTDLKDIVFNLRQIINKLVKFNAFGSKLAFESGMGKENIVVIMSESMQNILDTYLKTGVYNLQFLYDNYTVETVSDQDYEEANEDLAHIFIMDKRHLFTAVRDEVTESQYDVPSQTYGVFYTVDKMYGSSGLFKSVYFDASTALDVYI